MADRLNREQKKAETRRRLLDAASTVFAKRGYHGASVEDVAEEAGFTKGAVYSNFDSKEDLFFALLDEHIDSRVREVEIAVSAEGPIADQARDAGEDFMAFMAQEREWMLLFIEFWAFAVRDPRLRERFAARWNMFRAETARMIASRAEHIGVTLPLPAELLATAAFAMGNGIALEKLSDPDAVPDELYGFMLSLFFGAIVGAEPTGDVPAR